MRLAHWGFLLPIDIAEMERPVSQRALFRQITYRLMIGLNVQRIGMFVIRQFELDVVYCAI